MKQESIGVPKYLPDGSRNPVYARRVYDRQKEKMGEVAFRQMEKERRARWNLANPGKMSAYVQKYRDANREAVKARGTAQRRKWTLKYPEKYELLKRRMGLRKYNLTLEEYDALLAAQLNGCKICGTAHVDKPRERLHVDHDHATGEVRGLLCYHCNNMLGKARDNVEVLQRAILYIKREL